MGLRNAAQSLQKMMDFILAGMEQNCYCYMDDVLIFAKDHVQHEKVVEELFRRLQDNGLAINLDKCIFATTNLDITITPLLHPVQTEAGSGWGA